MKSHQDKQKEIIDDIARQIDTNTLKVSVVTPVTDYTTDPRICLTSVHFPHQSFLEKIQTTIIEPLRSVEPNAYYYTQDNLHMTIKNIRVIHDPPRFTYDDVIKAGEIYTDVIPKHKKFNIFFYRLLLFPNNVALVGTTDNELDRIILDVDRRLKEEGLPDDKIYTNSTYFFSNVTLARFYTPPSEAYRKKVRELSDTLMFEPYAVDTVTLLTGNATLQNRTIHGQWHLQE